MEFLQDSVPMVSLAVTAAGLYARVASSLLRPGLPRLVALLPVLAFLAAVPLAFSSSTIIRATAALFLAWLCAFKVALLAVGRRPLDPALPVLPFLFIALLPVMPRRGGSAGCSPGDDAAGAAASKAKSTFLVSCAVKIAFIASTLHLHQFMNRLHLYVRLTLHGIDLYCFLDLLLRCVAAAGGPLGMEMEPQFDRPLLATSLSNFWGRRWNLVVSTILRLSVYDPVRARVGKPAGILATFLVSGLMHEALVYYVTLRRPTGEMATFFLLHGVGRVAEEWCALRWAARGWPSPPRAVATLLVWISIGSTSLWLVFPPVCRGGGEDKLLEELY